MHDPVIARRTWPLRLFPQMSGFSANRSWMPKSAARLLGIPRSSVYEYAKRGDLPHVKIGKHVKFIRSDLESVVRERRVGA